MKIVLLLLILFSFKSFAENCYVYVTSPVANFTQSTSDQSIAVDLDLVKFSNSNRCRSYYLGFSKGSAGSYDRKLYNGGYSVNYNIYEKENTSKELWSAYENSSSRKIKVDMDSWYKRVTVYVKLPAPTSTLQTGLYTDSTQIQILPRSNGSTGGGFSQLTTNLNIQSDINLSLVGRGGQYDENQTSHTLNFGTMTTGKMRSFDLIVKANTGYRVSVSSEYDGSLAHNEKSNYKVGYTFSVNGSGMSLVGSKSSPKQIFSSNSPSQNGRVIEIDVSLLNTEQKLSGPYSDYIYFTAISN